MSSELVRTDSGQRPWAEVVGSFLDTRRAANTQRVYGHRLRMLVLDLGGYGPGDVTGAQLAAWGQGIRALADAGTWAPGTSKGHIMTARSFFHFARALGQSAIGKDVLETILPSPREQVLRPFQVLSITEQAAVLGALEGQDRRIIATLLYSGVRASELCKLRTIDYYTDEQGRRWLAVQGKGGKGRTVPVGRALALELGTPARAAGALFVSRQGSGHYKSRRIAQIVKAAAARAEIDKRISPHSLRHTAAITWLREGKVPVTIVQAWLGHSSLATTQRYLDHIASGEAWAYMP